MTKAIEIKFVAEDNGFAIFENGVAISATYKFKPNAIYWAEEKFPGEQIAVFKRNGEFQKFA
jgi:hypothetical protein